MSPPPKLASKRPPQPHRPTAASGGVEERPVESPHASAQPSHGLAGSDQERGGVRQTTPIATDQGRRRSKNAPARAFDHHLSPTAIDLRPAADQNPDRRRNHKSPTGGGTHSPVRANDLHPARSPTSRTTFPKPPAPRRRTPTGNQHASARPSASNGHPYLSIGNPRQRRLRIICLPRQTKNARRRPTQKSAPGRSPSTEQEEPKALRPTTPAITIAIPLSKASCIRGPRNGTRH